MVRLLGYDLDPWTLVKISFCLLHLYYVYLWSKIVFLGKWTMPKTNPLVFLKILFHYGSKRWPSWFWYSILCMVRKTEEYFQKKPTRLPANRHHMVPLNTQKPVNLFILNINLFKLLAHKKMKARKVSQTQNANKCRTFY